MEYLIFEGGQKGIHFHVQIISILIQLSQEVSRLMILKKSVHRSLRKCCHFFFIFTLLISCTINTGQKEDQMPPAPLTIISPLFLPSYISLPSLANLYLQ